jgi:hypothetical protein
MACLCDPEVWHALSEVVSPGVGARLAQLSGELWLGFGQQKAF